MFPGYKQEYKALVVSEFGDLKGVNGMGEKIEIDEKERLKKHMLLDKLMDGCYIEPITQDGKVWLLLDEIKDSEEVVD